MNFWNSTFLPGWVVLPANKQYNLTMKKFMDTTNQNRLAVLKDWKFWFLISIAILILIAIFIDYFNEVINIATESIKIVNGEELNSWHFTNDDGTSGYDYAGYTFYYFTYFTTQSNLFVAIWCLIFVSRWNKKSIVDNDLVTYAVATYITVTMLIFQSMLFPLAFIKDAKGDMPISSWSAQLWFTQEVLHLVAPIMFIVFVLVFRQNSTNISTKELLTKKLWISFTYPLVWGIGELIRGEFYYRSNRPMAAQYHYFFMNIHQNGGEAGYPIAGLSIPGAVWFVIALLFIILISVGFFTLYNFVINKRTEKQNVIA